MTGLNSAIASFNPADSPWSYAADAPNIEYSAKDWFDVSAFIFNEADLRAQSEKFLKLAEVPWYGDRTGDTITQVSRVCAQEPKRSCC